MKSLITIHPKCPACKKPNEVVTFEDTAWTCTECDGCKVWYSFHMMMFRSRHIVYNIVVGFGYDERDDVG